MHKKSVLCFIWLLLFYLACLVGCVISVRLFNQSVGLILGFCILILTLPFCIVFRKKKYAPVIFSLFNGIGTGFSIGTYYVSLAVEFTVLNAVISIAVCLVLYVAYTILIRKVFIKSHPRLFTALTLLILLVAFIIGWVNLSPELYSYMTFMFLVYAFYVFALIIPAQDSKELFWHIGLCSYGALFLVSVIVLIIMSQGDGLSFDFFDVDLSFDVTDINTKYKKRLRP